MELRAKLNKLLSNIGLNPDRWPANIDKFYRKIELLYCTNRYSRLLKCLFSCKEINTLNSHIFEVLFAYDFESNDLRLEYEVKQIPEESHSIDFRCALCNHKILYFELRVMQQRKWITGMIESQLNSIGKYEIMLDGNDEKAETIRLQNLILEKCMDRNGNPIKFRTVSNGIYNIIVVNVSELHLFYPDRFDCLLAINGDPSLESVYRRGIFGLCQQLPLNYSAETLEYYNKFKHFRENIHAVMFVKYDGTGDFGRLFLDQGLEYYLIGNPYLFEEADFIDILTRLAFLKGWSEKEGL